MIKIVLCVNLILICCISCDAQSMISESINSTDQSGKKIGLWKVCDTRKILFKEIWYGNNEKIDSVKFFNLEGSEIKNFSPVTSINTECLKAIQDEVSKKINWKEIVETVKGGVLLHFYVNSNYDLIDVRIIKGISESVDNEVLNAVKIIDEKTLLCAIHNNEITQIMINIKFQ